MNKPTNIIWLPEGLREEMSILASNAYPNETGGVLIGYDAGNGLVITEITGPGPDAIHKPHAFTPDYAYHDAEVQRIYNTSARRHTYLGDWHSHPDGRAILSSKDKRTLRTIARCHPARAPAPIMGILARDTPWRFGVWRHLPRSLRMRRFFHRYEEMTLMPLGMPACGVGVASADL